MIFDVNWNEVTEPDLELGQVNTCSLDCVLEWIIDTPAKTELRTLAEYPNGGRDIALVEVSPEVGHWNVTYDNGKVLPFMPEVPSDADKATPFPMTYAFDIYKPFSEEELAANRREIEEEAAKAEREAKNEALLLGLEDWQNTTIQEIEKVANITSNLDENIAETETVQSVLLALGEVGEMAAEATDNAELLHLLMAAVAELGELVSLQLDQESPENESEE